VYIYATTERIAVMIIFTKILNKLGLVQIKKYNDYIRKSNELAIKETILKKDKELQNLADDLNELHKIELGDKDAIIYQLKKENEENSQQVKNSKLAYYESLKGMKTNARISNELARTVKKFLEQSTEIYQSFEIIKQQAIAHKETMDKRDEKVKRLLGLDI
jgi:hypothetical protein